MRYPAAVRMYQTVSSIRPLGRSKGGLGEPRDRERAFLSEIIERQNDLFGTGLSDDDKTSFALHISRKLRGNDVVMAQVVNNPKDMALKADLPKAATEAVIGAMQSHQKLAEQLLKDKDMMSEFVDLIFDLLTRPEVEAGLATSDGRPNS